MESLVGLVIPQLSPSLVKWEVRQGTSRRFQIRPQVASQRPASQRWAAVPRRSRVHPSDDWTSLSLRTSGCLNDTIFSLDRSSLTYLTTPTSRLLGLEATVSWRLAAPPTLPVQTLGKLDQLVTLLMIRDRYNLL